MQASVVNKQTRENAVPGNIDTVGARLGRGAAMSLLAIPEDEFLSGIRTDPGLMVFINQVHQFSMAHAKDLARWAEVMLEVSERAQAVSDRVKRNMPEVWLSTQSHPVVNAGISGTA